jgi:predicted RNA-binding protein with PIN domain
MIQDMAQCIPMPYWFDGNNLIGQSAAVSRERPQNRQAFLSALSTYYKSGGSRFLVYFDGDDPGGALPPAGIRIRYSAPLSADDTIVRRLREIGNPGEVIVVSNDHELQSRCRNAGAAVMNWSQFDSKMKTRKIHHVIKNDTQQQVDVDDWVEYFGLDEKEIQKIE